MKKVILFALALVLSLSAMADDYSSLWKKVDEARNKDLPRTQINLLDQIAVKASRERAYGHLLKAGLMRGQCLASLSPDSVAPFLSRLEQRQKTADPVLRAVYASVLGTIYAQNPLDENEVKAKEKRDGWYRQSLANPGLLASHKCAEYEPAVVKGDYSKAFNGDLLHVIGMQASAFKLLADYYEAHGNRAAACLCALLDVRQTKQQFSSRRLRQQYISRLDSLITRYGDLPEGGEVAIERYEAMSDNGYASEQERYQYTVDAIRRWSSWSRINVLKNAQMRLLAPMMTYTSEDNLVLPNTPVKLNFTSLRNVSNLCVSIFKVNVDGNREIGDVDYQKTFAALKPYVDGNALQTVVRSYDNPAWQTHKDSILLNGLPVGVYLIEARTSGSMNAVRRNMLYVSNLYTMWVSEPGARWRFAVVNATTGTPVAGARLSLTKKKNGKTGLTTLTTDNNGEAQFAYDRLANYTLWTYTSGDRASTRQQLTFYYDWSGNEEPNYRANIYTDRGIYRPGQTVHASVIAWKADKKTLKSAPAAGLPMKFSLTDANGKVVGEQTVSTDSYGAAATDFALPATGLTGNYYLTVTGEKYYARCGMRVEQYKRPTFEVTFDEYKEAYKAGDTISVRGVAKTYSGMPVQHAKVSYTISRSQGPWWWRRYASEQLDQDTLTTDGQGAFIVRLPLNYPENQDATSQLFNFDVKATVTDVAGESHEASTSIPLSERTTFLETNLPDKTLRDSLQTITFSYRNLQGESIAATVSYRFDDGRWQQAKAGEAVRITGKLASGVHHLEAVCQTDTIRRDVVVFTLNDKQPATRTHDWAYCSATQFPTDGRPVYVQLGASDDATCIYYDIIANKKIIEQGRKMVSNAVFTRSFKYDSSYGDGLTVNAAWVVGGKLYAHHYFISRPVPDNRLRLTWKTFRDKLTPGQGEQWTLHVASPNGKPAKATLLSTMYDKSLYAIQPFNWSFENTFDFYGSYSTWTGRYDSRLSNSRYSAVNEVDVPSLTFSHLDDRLLSGFSNREWPEVLPVVMAYGMNVRGGKMMMAKMSRANDMVLNEMAVVRAEAPIGQPAASPSPSSSSSAISPSEPQQSSLRENLQETAFFYPTLSTDNNGDVNIHFTLPESVTTWRFMGLAHDSLMNYGLINAEAVASKAVMVQPNMPRFLRDGDRATLSARIFNTTDKALSGNAHLIIFDPETEQTLLTATTPFTTEAKGTTTANFDIDTKALAEKAKGQNILVCRITADGDGFSDGEQHYLPLLPNREQVINTIPFYQHSASKANIDLSHLFPADASHRRLTVEYTNNPAWLVVQSLPTLANPWQKDAMSLASAIYANVIGKMILSASPKIAQTIRLWQQETGKETSLTSNLDKDEDLKTMVLDETPWVAEANRESDQKRQLAGFLDQSTIDYRVNHFTTELCKLQNSDGSFSWWPGMDGSVYMTMMVAETLSRLKVLGATATLTEKSELDNSLTSSFTYLDRKMAEEVKQLKELAKKGNKYLAPSEIAVHWLYASALNQRAKTADILYMVHLLDKQPTRLTIYGKAVSAVILAQYGKTQHASDYLQSLREYTVYTDEAGRYFDTPKAYYSWYDYRIPTQTAAIEALKLLAPNDTTIAQLQQWLLHEKRTTAWSTNINSVNAVYAFLYGADGKAELNKLATGEPTALYLDGKAIELPKATAGIGFVKVAEPLTTTAAAPRQLTADKTTDGTSWGAVYGQFQQPATSVTNATAGLKVSREMYLADDKSATDRSTFKVGQKVVVRITIEADRDYDFVTVQDKRAACMEPVSQLSGYHWGYYLAPQDNATNYYFDQLSKGRHVVETTYFIDRAGSYSTGICTAQCTYAPEYTAREAAKVITVE